MTNLELDLIRLGLAPLDTDRLARDRAAQAEIRAACAGLFRSVAARLEGVARRIEVDKDPRAV